MLKPTCYLFSMDPSSSMKPEPRNQTKSNHAHNTHKFSPKKQKSSNKKEINFLLELDSSRRLLSDIIKHSADTVDLVDDTGRDLAEELSVKVEPVSGHVVGGGDGTEGNALVVDTLVSHDTDGADGEKGGVSLGDLAVETGGHDLRDEDVVGLAGNADLVGGDLSDDTDGNSGTGEGVTPDKLLWDSEVGSHDANLVLEELTKGLDNLELHVGGETSNVVVGLDGGGGSLEGKRLNHVGVKSSLEKEVDVSTGLLHDTVGLTLEDLNEEVSNDLTLLLRLLNTLEAGQELSAGVNNGKVDSEVLGQGLVDGLTLVETHDTVVDEDSVETVSNGPLHQLGSYGRVDTSGNGTDNLTGRSNGLANTLDLGLDEEVHGPVLLGSTELDGEVGQKLLTLGGVGNLGVELDSVELALGVGDSGVGSVGGSSDGQEPGGKSTELVTVRHPDVHLVINTLEESIDVRGSGGVAGDVQDGVSVLLTVTSTDVLSVVPGDLLKTVADSENGDLWCISMKNFQA
jgi:hypothetical protein